LATHQLRALTVGLPSTQQTNSPDINSRGTRKERQIIVADRCVGFDWPPEQVAQRPEDGALNRKVECLATAPLFYGLSHAQCREIAEAADEMWYPQGQTIFLQDDPVYHVFVIASGMVKITQIDKGGKETLLRVERKGDLIDDFTGGSEIHFLAARAIEDCCVLAWDASDFEAFSERMIAIQRNAVAIMRNRLRVLQERFCDVSTQRVPQRLARLVLHLAAESTPGALRPIVLSREEMAQMAGTSLFSVSRLLSEWADSNVITVDRRTVVVEDLERLEQLAHAA
jgi:CRP/FNR family transcriptional regulator, nitrogen oxide reductase regulator